MELCTLPRAGSGVLGHHLPHSRLSKINPKARPDLSWGEVDSMSCRGAERMYRDGRNCWRLWDCPPWGVWGWGVLIGSLNFLHANEQLLKVRLWFVFQEVAGFLLRWYPGMLKLPTLSWEVWTDQALGKCQDFSSPFSGDKTEAWREVTYAQHTVCQWQDEGHY